MCATIRRNGLLQRMDNLIDWLAFPPGDLVKRCMMECRRILQRERTIEVVFGNMVDIGDHMNSHPGMNGAHISSFDGFILLLEHARRLNGIDGGKNENAQHDEQKQTEQPQPGAFTARIHHLLTFPFWRNKHQ